ncbi:MAG: hypothetical protein PWP71_858, partial [Clostridia bacterium]|nr:hypothetical protein [Clostridia bacterium]
MLCLLHFIVWAVYNLFAVLLEYPMFDEHFASNFAPEIVDFVVDSFVEVVRP